MATEPRFIWDDQQQDQPKQSDDSRFAWDDPGAKSALKYSSALGVEGGMSIADNVRGAAQTLARGASFSLADEAVGAMVAGATKLKDAFTPGDQNRTFGEVYRDVTDAERFTQNQFAKENPKTAAALEIGGALLTGGGGGVATVKGVSKLAPSLLRGAESVAGRGAQFIGRNALLGAVPGALYGAGAAEEGQRIEGAQKGAAIGAVAAPVLGGALVGAARTGKALISPLRQMAKGSAGRDEQIAYEFLANKVDEMDSNAQTIRRNLDRVGEDAMLLEGGGFTATRDGTAITPTAKGTSLVDFAEDMVQTNDRSRQLIQKRILNKMQAQHGRVTKLIDNALGTDKTTPESLYANIAAAKKAKAAPLYERAYASKINNDALGGVDAKTGEKLLSLRDIINDKEVRPLIKKAMGRVESDSRLPKDQRSGLVTQPEGRRILLPGEEALPPQPKSQTAPNLAVWDRVKKLLDAKAKSALMNGDDPGFWLDKKQNLVAQLDRQVPAYGAARKVWADEQALAEAVEFGENLHSMISNKKVSSRQILRMFDQMSEAEQEHARIAAGQVMKNIIDNTRMSLGEVPPASLISQIYGSKAQREVANRIIGGGARARSFERALGAERQSHANMNQMLRGSQTKRRMESAGMSKGMRIFDAAAETTLNVFYATTGNRWAAVKVAQRVADVLGGGSGMNQRVRENLADILTTDDAAKIKTAIDEVEKILGKRNMPKRLERARNQQMFKWLREKDNANYLHRVLGSKEGLRAAVAAEQAGEGDENIMQIDIKNGRPE